jgi:hypothetical protein
MEVEAKNNPLLFFLYYTNILRTACRSQLVDVQSLDTPEQKHGKQPFGVVGFK